MVQALAAGLLHIALPHKPMWIHALWNQPYLTVYRSILVYDNAALYAPIKEVLNTFAHTIIHSSVHEDQDMMFGEAVFTIYEIGDEV